MRSEAGRIRRLIEERRQGQAPRLPHAPAGVLLGAVLCGRARPDTETGNRAARGRGDEDRPVEGTPPSSTWGPARGSSAYCLRKMGPGASCASISPRRPRGGPQERPRLRAETGSILWPPTCSPRSGRAGPSTSYAPTCPMWPSRVGGAHGRVREFEPKHRPGGRGCGNGAVREVPGGDRRLSRRGRRAPLRDRRRGPGGLLGALLKKAGFETAVLRDLAGRQRVIKGSWKSSS